MVEAGRPGGRDAAPASSLQPGLEALHGLQGWQAILHQVGYGQTVDGHGLGVFAGPLHGLDLHVEGLLFIHDPGLLALEDRHGPQADHAEEAGEGP